MIELNEVSYETQQELPILANLTMKVLPGEFIVLTGPSGSGKSTLFNLINGLIPELYEGKVTGKGQIVESKFPLSDFSKHIQQLGVVFQNPKTHFFTTDVFSELAFVMENHGSEPQHIRKRAAVILKFFLLESLKEASMFQLSGGQRQLVSIAAASMLPHQLLVLDEPSSNLDEQAVARLKQALLQLKAQGTTILIAEHRLAYLSDCADRFLVMNEGTIKKELTSKEIKILSEEERKSLGLRSVKPIHLERTTPKIFQREATMTLRLEQLQFFYRKQTKPALDISKLMIDNRQIIGIIGENGAGKSTFFDVISGLVKPKKGKIYLNNRLLTKKECLLQTFLVMQDVNLQLFFETVEKELVTHAKKIERFEEVCQKFQLTHLLQRHPHTLSGGEKQRVAIATAILSGKKVLLFDEPTSGLDYANMVEVSQLLKSLQSEELLVMVISHDQEFLQATCGTIKTLHDGKFLEE